jgi:putative IMPACT (imprinted ancient) family translation regulator
LKLKTPTTIEFTSEEILHKEKIVNFFGSAYPIQSEDEVKLIIDGLRNIHMQVSYAHQIGTSTISYRANDDGEPSNSVGMAYIKYFPFLSQTHL